MGKALMLLGAFFLSLLLATSSLDSPFTVLVRDGKEELVLHLKNEKEIEHFENYYGKENVERPYYTPLNNPRRQIKSVLEQDDLLVYLNVEGIEFVYDDIDNNYDYCTSSEMGRSSLDRPLTMMTINTHGSDDINKYPALLLMANMHGDETVGNVLLVNFAFYLCSNYMDESHPEVTNLLDNTIIYIVPSMNPDGYEEGTRENAQNIDLNRNFPDPWVDVVPLPAPETEAVMNFIIDHENIVIDFMMHGGAVVTNYPYDGDEDGYEDGWDQKNTHPNLPPDEELYYLVSSTYANLNQRMLDNPEFENGIVNGATWYALYHGFQDFGYFFHDIISVTLELSEIKDPVEEELPIFWDENLNSMMAYSSLGYQIGIRGVVTDSEGNVVSGATIRVQGIDKDYESIEGGYYYRLLEPGKTYTVECILGLNTISKVVELPVDQKMQVVVDFDFSAKDDDFFGFVRLFSNKKRLYIWVGGVSAFILKCLGLTFLFLCIGSCCYFCRRQIWSTCMSLRKKKISERKDVEYVDQHTYETVPTEEEEEDALDTFEGPRSFSLLSNDVDSII